jgi:aldose 1-epimerase
MSFAARTEVRRDGAGREAVLVVLEDGAGGGARVWPALGFNCFGWRAVRDGRVLDLLYEDPALFTEPDPRPTRSGIPVLFPFPNRIRGGRFAWDGKEYQLPLLDPAKKNAIHGFACRHPWRLAGHGADAAGAWVRGQFRGSADAPDCRGLWPADYEIALTVRLGPGRLRLEAEVHNPDAVPLPFGLGYHPYFRLPPAPGGRAEDCTVCVPARSYWVLEESLPTGEKEPVSGGRDLTTPRRFGELQLDDVLTDLPPGPAADGLRERAVLRGDGAEVRVLWSDEFRDAVVFTPPHRHAFCVEPYTCTTDAVNLQARGVEAGWRVLPPGGRWSAVVELRV